MKRLHGLIQHYLLKCYTVIEPGVSCHLLLCYLYKIIVVLFLRS